jgi:phosphoglycolate phosphatase
MPGPAIVFDMDGVLVDSREAIVTSLNHALAASGRPERPAAELLALIGPPVAQGLATLIDAAPDSAEVATLVADYRAHHADTLVAGSHVMDGIEPALVELATLGPPLAVATTKPMYFAEPLLEALGLRGHFAALAAPDLALMAPPKAVTVSEALEALGADHGVMIGDRSYDVVGGRAHGLATVGVTWGFGDLEELAAAGADVVVQRPAELVGAVAALLDR